MAGCFFCIFLCQREQSSSNRIYGVKSNPPPNHSSRTSPSLNVQKYLTLRCEVGMLGFLGWKPLILQLQNMVPLGSPLSQLKILVMIFLIFGKNLCQLYQKLTPSMTTEYPSPSSGFSHLSWIGLSDVSNCKNLSITDLCKALKLLAAFNIFI